MRVTPALLISTRLICFALLFGALTGTAHPAPPPAAPLQDHSAPPPVSAITSGSHATISTLAGENVGKEAPFAAVAAPDGPRTGGPTSAAPLKWRQVHAAVTAQQATRPVDAPANDPAPAPVLSWETGAGKSYLIPAIEVPGFLVLLNLYDRTFLHSKTRDGKRTYDTNLSAAWDHLTEQDWVYDQDPFNVNQIGHPYQGATMYGIARSSGLNFWQSLLYSNTGSFLWEMAGENSRPSINDLITTGNAGSLLGEALFRMSSLVLEDAAPRPDTMHEVGAALLSPPTGFNRWAYGERFKPVFPSHRPALFWRGRLGASVSGNSQQNATVDFQMSYGLPGKPGYTYQRPFDYFDFQMGGLSRANNPVSYVLLRGLLYGRDFHAGENYRGIWGLYGGYDYFSPTSFRVSTTALSMGTTGQYWLAREVALQGSLLGGLGFGAAGKTPSLQGNRDYHYGVTPQVLLALRLLLADRASMETIGRGYYVSGTGSDNSRGYEQIARITTGFTVRVFGRHAVGFQFVESLRYAHYGSLPRTRQSEGTVSLVYTFLGDSRFGAVEWREQGGR